MFKLIIIFIIILIVLFPIKIKLTIFFNGKTLKVKIFKFKLLNINIDDSFKNIFCKNSEDEKKEITSHKKKKSKLLNRISINKMNLFSDFVNNRFKPVIIFDNSFSYSTEDAALTAILYGVFNTVIYSLFSFLNLLLNIKIKENEITPIFEDKTSINLNNKSIIKVNFVQIIIMLVILLKNIKFKGGTQKGNTYGK